MKDATGKDFVVGARYGYYKNKNGFTTVCIGTCKKFENGKAQLIDIQVKEYLYNDGLKDTLKTSVTKSVSMFCNILFPVL